MYRNRKAKNISGNFKYTIYNKPGKAQVGAPLKVQKKYSDISMQRDTIVESF